MKRSDQEKLLGRVFADALAEVRSRTLQAGLATVRRQRRDRRFIRGCAVLLLPVAALVWLTFERAPAPASDGSHLAAAPAGSAAETTEPGPAERVSGVKIITDEELLALFPDRPLALIGKPGQQRLLFLDEDRGREEPGPF